MTVLSKEHIWSRLADHSLVITPIVEPGVQIGEMSIDLRMGNAAALVRGSDQSHITPVKRGADKFETERSKHRKLERVSCKFGQRLMLHVGSLILVSTYEWVKLPIDLKGVVTARSCWAREGLSIATATFINPCYNGIITLELANLGEIPIALYPGMRVAQLALYKVDRDKNNTNCPKKPSGQFDLSYEPKAGNISLHDEPFTKDESNSI